MIRAVSRPGDGPARAGMSPVRIHQGTAYEPAEPSPIQDVKKRAEVFFVVAPSAHRALVQRLADLPVAGGENGRRRAMKFEAGGIPRQAEKFDQAAALGFQIPNEVLVLHFQNPQRQRLPPVIHQPIAGAILVSAIHQIE